MADSEQTDGLISGSNMAAGDPSSMLRSPKEFVYYMTPLLDSRANLAITEWKLFK